MAPSSPTNPSNPNQEADVHPPAADDRTPFGADPSRSNVPLYLWLTLFALCFAALVGLAIFAPAR
jgi:hypothetical protein